MGLGNRNIWDKRNGNFNLVVMGILLQRKQKNGIMLCIVEVLLNMKKTKNKLLKILGIVVIVVLVLFVLLSIVISNVSSSINSVSENEVDMAFSDYVVKEEKMTAYVNGTGEITSFNIKVVDVPTYGLVKEKYVNDGDVVGVEQKLFKVSIDGDYKTINSPIKGMYFETENAGSMVYQVYNLDDIGIEMYVSEKDVALLANGQKAIVKVTALNKEVDGTVSYISKLPRDGKFKVKIKIPYTDEIKFGYGTSVKVVVSEKDKALVIPYDALQMDSENRYYVIKQEFKSDFYKNSVYDTPLPESAKTYVDVGTITNNQVEIVSGLKAGDIIEEWNW